MGLNVILPLAGGLAVVAVLAVVVLMKNRTAYLGPVKEELQKEKGWLRRGEYNAAMVKGRQNLELLLKLVAEKNGIQLDNSAKAQADAREEEERRNKNGRRKTPKVMTYQQFNRWLSDNGYLDRVARWEMNQVRLIGNKAAHENYADKDDAWNQFNYLEDILKTITERSQNPKKRQEQGKKKEHNDVQKDPQGRKQQGSNQPEQEPAKKKRRRRRKPSNKKTEPALAGVAAEKVEAKPAKVEKKPVEAEVKTAPASEAVQEETKKKPRRRRRRKKPQNPQNTQNAQNSQVQGETVKVQEPKKESVPQKETAVTNDGEKKPNPHKRRRRRRPRKPQGTQSVHENGKNSSGEQE